MTKAQETYERIEALIAQGGSKADAFKQLAEETGKPVKSLQGAYYQHSRKVNGTQKPKRRETTPTNAVADATALLTRAIEAIDQEIEVARERAEEAQAEYDALKASAHERKQALAAKIEALEA